MQVRAPAAKAVAKLQQRFPGAIGYESRGSADLHVNAPLFGPRFGDTELTAVAPIAQHAVGLDLTGSAVTDRSAGQLARMERLRTLRLGGTAAGDATVVALAGLKELASLSLYHTAVTAAAAPHLARLSSLKRLYAGETGLAARAR